MTECDRICLEYLNHLMEAPASSIGREIVKRRSNPGGSECGTIGGAVAGRLRRQGLVTRVADLKAWRITAAGRIALGQCA